MTLGFTDDAYNLATGTRDAFGALSDELVAEGFPPMVSRDGDRELADQIKFFVSRYRQQATGSGKYGDVRIWDGSKYGYPGGKRWVRVSSAGTVAPPADPPTSNHGKRRSNDLTYPYNDRNTAAHKRAQQLAPRHNITWEGKNFREDWHWTYWGPLGEILTPNHSGGSAGTSKEDLMTTLMVKANVNIYTLDRGQIKLNDDLNVVERALAAGIPQIDCTGTVANQNDQFAGWLDFYGIPRNVVAHSQGWVLNPETGKHEKNGMWNWERVNKALLAQLLAKK